MKTDKKERYGGGQFTAGEVRLTDGIFKTSRDLGLKFIMSLDIDRLLAPVAYSSGASKDKSMFYGGWEAYSYRVYNGTGISGHSLGHWLSAASAMYLSTGCAAVKEMLDYAVDKLKEYQDADGGGFIGGFEKSGFESALKGELKVSEFDLNGYWVPWYSLHKIYRGLIDAYIFAGNETALLVARRFADWAVNVTSGMSDEKFAKMLKCEYGGMNEVMAHMYRITGERKYLGLALRFSDDPVLNELALGRDELEGKHANTQIPKVLGAAALYEADAGRSDHRAAAEFFYNTVVNHRSYVIGGNSNREHFENINAETLGTQTLETCNTHNMMRLAEYLYRWEHKAEYMDNYERALFNHILASQDPDTGEKTYFMSTKPGHFKVYSDALGGNSFWCCVGSGMENPGRYGMNIYYRDGCDFFVNLFISSEVEWREKGIVVSQRTNFPYEDETVIKIERGGAHFNMKIRIPSWTALPARVRVNDEEAALITESGYYTIDRFWNEGDKVTVTLPMSLHTYAARGSAHRCAFMYGPIVLAGALGRENFPDSDLTYDHTAFDSYECAEKADIVVDSTDPKSFITPADPEKLKFTLHSDGRKITLVPYFDVHHERYALYWSLYKKGERADEDDFERTLDDATADVVRPNEQQSEIDHNLREKDSVSGYSAKLSRGWRSVDGADGYFEYDMKLPHDGKAYLAVLFHERGCENGFRIFAEGEEIAPATLPDAQRSGASYTYYEIPTDIRSNKEKITVKFTRRGADERASAVLEARITTKIVT